MTSSSWKVANEKLCASCEDDDVEECLINVLVEELCDYGKESEPKLERMATLIAKDKLQLSNSTMTTLHLIGVTHHTNFEEGIT